MGLTFTVARRSLFSRPGRTLFSILGIALGIATVVGVVTLDHSTIGGLSGRYSALGTPDLELRQVATADDGPREIDLIDAIIGVESATAFFQNDAVVRRLSAAGEQAPADEPGSEPTRGGRGDSRDDKVRLYALDSASYAELGVHSLKVGRDLDPTRARREVLVGEPLAEKHGLAPGDTLLVSRPRRVARRACIEGELKTVGRPVSEVPEELAFEVVGVLAREKLGRRARGMVVLVDFEWGKELYEGAHIETRYWAKRDLTVDLERLEASLGAGYDYELNKAVVIGQAADERAFRTGVRMAGLLALVLGLYVIFHTLSMSLNERIGEVGTLHALGVTRTQVARIFLSEAVFLAGFGALAGLALGILLAWFLLSQGITTLGTGKDVDVFLVPWAAVVPLAVVGFGIALIGSVYPLSRLSGANTVAALRGEEALRQSGVRRGFHMFSALLLAVVLPGLYFVIVPVVGEITAPLVAVLLAGVGFLIVLVVLPLLMPAILGGVCAAITRPLVRLWPLSGRLAARAMRDSSARIAVSASAIALVCAGLVGLKGMTESLRGEIEVWADEAAVGKVWVKDLPNVGFRKLAAHVKQFPGVLGLEKGSARTYGSFLILGVDPSELAGYGPCAGDLSLQRALRNDHGIILSRRLAKERKYELGDYVLVTKADGTPQDFEVVAISDAYGYFPHPDERMYGVVSDEYMRRYFCLDVETVTDVAVRLSPDADPGVVEAAVRDFKVSGGGGGRGRGTRGGDGGDLAATAGGMGSVRFETGAELLGHHLMDIDRDFILFDILIGLTAALAALGVLNGQLLAALERSKEIGVLKALGVSRGQVAGMVLIESLVVGAVGGGLGVVLGSSMTPVVVRSLQELAGLALPQRGAGEWAALALAGAAALTLLAGLYPIWRMNRFDAVRAVRTG